MNKPFISLKVIYKNGKVLRISSRKTKRIFHSLKAGKFTDCTFHLSVTYQKGSQNSGVYKTRNDLIQALNAFLEKN